MRSSPLDLAVVLTFDDGPGPSTERLLDVLARHRARATFFMLGKNLLGAALDGSRQLALAVGTRVVREGHLLANHTMSHAAELSVEELRTEVTECDALAHTCYIGAGRPPPASIPVRLPFGHHRLDAERAFEALNDIGRPHCHWTGDPEDWRPSRTAEEIARAVLDHLEETWSQGKVPTVLLHDAGQGAVAGGERVGVTREPTVDAVDAVCSFLRDRQVRYLSVLETEPCRDSIPNVDHSREGSARAMGQTGVGN